MSYQKYHQIFKLFLITIAIIIGYKVLNFYSIILVHKSKFLSNIMFFAFPISSLFFLFFCVYSLRQRINVPRKIESPSLFICLSIILLIISTLLPLLRYSKLIKARNDQDVVQSVEQLADEVCLNPALSPDKRRDAAQHFYRISGHQVEYLDESGNKISYVPKKADKEMYLKYKNIMDKFDQSLTRAKNNISILLIFMFSSSIAFVFLLKYPKKTKVL